MLIPLFDNPDVSDWQCFDTLKNRLFLATLGRGFMWVHAGIEAIPAIYFSYSYYCATRRETSRPPSQILQALFLRYKLILTVCGVFHSRKLLSDLRSPCYL